MKTDSVPGTPIARLFVKRKSLPLAQVVAPAANRQAFTPYIVVTLLSLSPLKEYALSMALHRLYPVEVAHILSGQMSSWRCKEKSAKTGIGHTLERRSEFW
jgi:hypothetical protein